MEIGRFARDGVCANFGGHIDYGGGSGKTTIAVGDQIGDGCRAVEIGIRREGQCAVAVDHDRAIGRRRRYDRQRIQIGIGIIAKDVERYRRVLRRRANIIGRKWRCIGDAPCEGG